MPYEYQKPEEVFEFFHKCFDCHNQDRCGPIMAEQGLLISSALRREILLGSSFGKKIVNGSLRKFEFENLKGGVWRIYLPLTKV